jgi:amidase
MISELSSQDTEAVLVLPSTGCIPPLLSSTASELEAIRKQLFQLLCIAGLGGLPQVSIPACTYDHAPLGISLIANHGKDSLLLRTIQDLKIN